MIIKISSLVNQTVEINKDFRNDFYYECENGGRFDYDFLERNGWKGKVVSVECGRNINIVVRVEGKRVNKYFELEDIEVLYNGICLNELSIEYDWNNVKNEYGYEKSGDKCGLIY